MAGADPQRILADGKPIHLLRNKILGAPDNWHNMGYPYPDFVDCTALPALVCLNVFAPLCYSRLSLLSDFRFLELQILKELQVLKMQHL